jgi:hypothetical protein
MKVKREITIKEIIVLIPLGLIINILEKIVKTGINLVTDHIQEKINKNMTVLKRIKEIETMTETL